MKKSFALFHLLFSLLLLFSPNFLNAQTQEDFDVVTVSPSLSISKWEAGQGGDLILKLHLAKGYHAYAEKFHIEITEPSGFRSGELRISPLKTWYDKPTKRNR
ncbi:MAG TPA: protein-disulfide reductase DsbD family protein, partial [Pseudobdellovibrionaceae bacterium]|nr:protein-disulfide reductase DsbD family protein [Pseudobdellovibrionaceae bacterium]